MQALRSQMSVTIVTSSFNTCQALIDVTRPRARPLGSILHALRSLDRRDTNPAERASQHHPAHPTDQLTLHSTYYPRRPYYT